MEPRPADLRFDGTQIERQDGMWVPCRRRQQAAAAARLAVKQRRLIEDTRFAFAILWTSPRFAHAGHQDFINAGKVLQNSCRDRPHCTTT